MISFMESIVKLLFSVARPQLARQGAPSVYWPVEADHPGHRPQTER
jgi:hypothetical protein